MPIVASALVAFVALEHVGFAVLEMILWTTPFVRKRFGTTEAFAKESAVLASNQGLYNLFLAAGLAWSFFAEDAMVRPLRLFFLGCVFVAGIFGGLTASKRILFVQAIPAILALIVVVLG